jgi:hypothetical protein
MNFINASTAAWSARYKHDDHSLTAAQVKSLPIATVNGASKLVMMHGTLCHYQHGKLSRAHA